MFFFLCHLYGPNLCWTYSRSSLLFLLREAHAYLVHRSGLCTELVSARADKSGRSVSLDLLVMLFLMQPQILQAFVATGVHCWLMANLLSNSTIRSFSDKLLSTLVTSSMYWCRVLFPRVQDLVIFPCWTTWGCCWPISPACWVLLKSSAIIKCFNQLSNFV